MKLLNLLLVIASAVCLSLGPMHPNEIPSTCAIANPGDSLLISNGAFLNPGTIDLRLCEGTEKEPIIVRSHDMHGAIFSGYLTWILSGRWTTLSGVKIIAGSLPHSFSKVGGSLIQLKGMGSRLSNATYGFVLLKESYFLLFENLPSKANWIVVCLYIFWCCSMYGS